MSVQGLSTYSFKDVVGSFTHPLAGVQTFGGQIGVGSFIIRNTADRTQHDVASDGATMVSYISNQTGSMEIEMQQNSALHHFFLDWFNIVTTNAEAGNVANWASGSVVLTSTLDGATHVLTGVSPGKVPDKTYTASGGKVTWNLMAANVQSL